MVSDTCDKMKMYICLSFLLIWDSWDAYFWVCPGMLTSPSPINHLYVYILYMDTK